jgi:predicted enzyme related to lactoylglutathione lyase
MRRSASQAVAVLLIEAMEVTDFLRRMSRSGGSIATKIEAYPGACGFAACPDPIISRTVPSGP